MADALTPLEHAALGVTVELVNLLGEIIGEEKTREGDLGEVVHHVHAIQHMIMAQAAARAYPSELRLLGELIK
jgi:hypothetical protein